MQWIIETVLILAIIAGGIVLCMAAYLDGHEACRPDDDEDDKKRGPTESRPQGAKVVTTER